MKLSGAFDNGNVQSTSQTTEKNALIVRMDKRKYLKRITITRAQGAKDKRNKPFESAEQPDIYARFPQDFGRPRQCNSLKRQTAKRLRVSRLCSAQCSLQKLRTRPAETIFLHGAISETAKRHFRRGI